MDIEKIKKLGELRKHYTHMPTVREEMRNNLIRMLTNKQPLFRDLKGYDDTVIPRVINAIMCGHNMIILGERGQVQLRVREVHSLAGAQLAPPDNPAGHLS